MAVMPNSWKVTAGLAGSVNEYQLRLGRQRQVWFIPLADVHGVCR